MKERDHKNYDYLCVIIKKDAAEYLESFYFALGYEIVEVEEHKHYFNELEVVFRRPHKIPNKDMLQLLQIHVETLINGFGKYSPNRRTYSVVFGILTGLSSIALVVLGLIIAFAFSKPLLGETSFVWGVAASITGGVCLVAFTLFTLALSRAEGEYRSVKTNEIRDELAEIIKTALPLLEKTERSNTPQYATNNGAERVLNEQ